MKTATLDGVSRSERGTRSPVTTMASAVSAFPGSACCMAAAIAARQKNAGINPPVSAKSKIYNGYCRMQSGRPH